MSRVPMQIIIPMSGFGERFRNAGYKDPKPLLEVEGKPVIAHVLDLFPGEKDVIFICNREHLETRDFKMREVLHQFCPTGKVVGIDPHRLGPVYAVLKAFSEIDPDRPAIVNYCDFTCYWDYNYFKKYIRELECDGCIPAYRGFHPHSLNSTYYAYMREKNGWVTDIQEKKPFTNNPMCEFASSGTYYFYSGNQLIHYFREAIKRDLSVDGEYYVSLVYRTMIEDGLSIAVYELQHFMQWGKPEDFEEYKDWSSVFADLVQPKKAEIQHKGTVMVPLAGSGSRFLKEGYKLPKPLIQVSGLPMVVQAVRVLPMPDKYVFIVRKDLPGTEAVEKALSNTFCNSHFVRLNGLTDGQARTCLMGMKEIDLDAPLTIGACDNGAFFDPATFNKLMDDPETDILVWVARGHHGALRYPEMYGWVDADRDLIKRVSVKTPLYNPGYDPIIVGTFTFKRAKDFVVAAEHMIERNARVNDEFYVDTCINDAIQLGFNCRIFEIKHYLCWGTPDDLRTFEYWQSCFHKWPTHNYRLQMDRSIPAETLTNLERRFATTYPLLPGLKS